MQIVQESPEHHLLKYLDKIKQQPQGWVSICSHFSSKLSHEKIMADPGKIAQLIASVQQGSSVLLEKASMLFEPINDCVVYQFKDGDILVLARPASPKEQELIKSIYVKLQEADKSVQCSYKTLAGDMYNVQKMVDARLLSARCMDAYMAVSEVNKCSTIGIRRKRREESVVLIVEDDQFTGSYAMNIVNKETEAILVKNGEEAVISYIEHAPDVVFLDIHLPGLSGLKTLDAIMHVDPDAYVIMLSVDTLKESILSAYDRGATGFLKKPFSKERLLFTVAKSPYISKPIMVSTAIPEQTTVN